MTIPTDPLELAKFRQRSEANEVALRGIADFVRYLRQLEDVDDEELYEQNLRNFVKGAGSSMIDQINATGAYKEKGIYDDTDFLQFSVTMATLAMSEILAILPNKAFAQIVYNLGGNVMLGEIAKTALEASGGDVSQVETITLHIKEAPDADRQGAD